MSQRTDQPHPDTRERLLQAALHAFGHRDYDAVGTREIVEAAGANISAISYYFGGKRQLYLATAEYLALNLHASLRPLIEKVNAESARAGPERCRVLLQQLIGGFSRGLLSSQYGEDAPGFIFREQNHPTEAFDTLYTLLIEPLHGAITQLVAVIRGLSAEGSEAKMVAHSLMGMAMSFRAGRSALLRHLEREVYDARQIETITGLVARMAIHALEYESDHTDPES